MPTNTEKTKRRATLRAATDIASAIAEERVVLPDEIRALFQFPEYVSVSLEKLTHQGTRALASGFTRRDVIRASYEGENVRVSFLIDPLLEIEEHIKHLLERGANVDGD